MSCAWTQTRLFDYLDGLLDVETRRRIEEHVEACTDCAGYAEALGQAEEGFEDWTQSVLQRTGNGACAKSRDLLPGWVDEDLGDIDTELVGGHVAHCRECAALSTVMRTMRGDLAEFAEIEPDPAFLGEVLAATLRPEPVVLPWVARVDAWFARLLQRPRIAWEGAYLATACLVLLIVFPGSPLAGVPQKALDLARTGPTTIEQPFVAFKTNLNAGAQEALYSTRTAARSFAVRASAGSGSAYRSAKRGIGTLWDRIASDPLTDETQQQTSTNGDDK